MKKIKLTQGKYAMVDNEDFENLNRQKWFYSNHGYAVMSKFVGKKDNSDKCKYRYKYKRIYLHRIINKTPVGMQTDHINRNKLDNRKTNLRTVTKSQNMMNKGLLRNNSSGHNGISYDKIHKRWEASIGLNNRKKFLGYFINIKNAIIAREKAEILYRII